MRGHHRAISNMRTPPPHPRRRGERHPAQCRTPAAHAPLHGRTAVSGPPATPPQPSSFSPTRSSVRKRTPSRWKFGQTRQGCPPSAAAVLSRKGWPRACPLANAAASRLRRAAQGCTCSLFARELRPKTGSLAGGHDRHNALSAPGALSGTNTGDTPAPTGPSVRRLFQADVTASASAMPPPSAQGGTPCRSARSKKSNLHSLLSQQGKRIFDTVRAAASPSAATVTSATSKRISTSPAQLRVKQHIVPGPPKRSAAAFCGRHRLCGHARRQPSSARLHLGKDQHRLPFCAMTSTSPRRVRKFISSTRHPSAPVIRAWPALSPMAPLRALLPHHT